ncbi:uncharacterized protein L201_001610 [Kwoniella dendrophila CBS 6074]|uniref:Mediator complex subunit 11 n=1 Tax=Kwoniella dendrophila CBS 6074 TaxID=1295534 RepID=A0AAX4JMX6_9TREE
MSSPAGETTASISDGLELESLDSQSLFNALTNVEKAIPELLLSVKPIISHLISSENLQQNGSVDEETSGILAREGVERYMNSLDKIQFILRQTVYYLHATKISSTTLLPPSINNIPTPFATTLPNPPSQQSQQQSQSDSSISGIELGLYANRIEEKILSDIVVALKALKEEKREGNKNADQNGASSDKMDVEDDQ